MADDWIKMRTDIYRDPRVCVMADFLLDPRGDLGDYVGQHLQRDMTVTRNVMRHAVVGALVATWGVFRRRGKRDGNDLIVNNVALSVIDDVADMPGFGDAMAEVGWVIESEIGFSFPRFFDEFNVDPTESSRAKNAERQRRYREKQAEKSKIPTTVQSNVTVGVTHAPQSNVREEKRREE